MSSALRPPIAAADEVDVRFNVHETASLFTALTRTRAVVVFALDGTVLRANQNFLTLFGYISTGSRAGSRRDDGWPKRVARAAIFASTAGR
jgi:hypothetical protein